MTVARMRTIVLSFGGRIGFNSWNPNFNVARILPVFIGFLLFFNSTALAGERGNTESLLKAILAPAGPAGFCVHLGCGEGALTAELARNERLVVHALEADPTKAGRARALLQARGLYGRAAVEPWAEPFLPYADNLVNVLVAEQPGLVAESEMLRVLAPLGTLWVRREGVWQSRQKPWPKEFDEWTHARHGADGNMVSRDTAVHTPTGLRWIAGPPQDTGGRRWYYDHVLVSSAGRSFYQFDDAIVARDAFNGRLLWRRATKAYTFKESGTPSGVKIGTRTSKVRPVAAGNRLYAAIDGKLAALDAADGQTVQELAEIEKPREIALLDSQLLLSDQSGLRAFTLEGKLLWRHDEFARRMVAGDGKVLFLNTNKLVALDLITGKELWRAEHPKAVEAVTCSYYRGVLVIERSSWRDDGAGSGVVAFSGDTGELLWEKEYTPGMTHYKESRAFFAEDLVWLEVETGLKPKGRLYGLDPRTGIKQKELGTRGLHCSVPIATDQYLITAELEFTDLKSGAQSRARMTKSACRLPFIPGNGLLYTFPVQCECYPMLRGYMGLAQSPRPGDAGSPRLQPGPAFSRVTGSPGAANLEEEWPMYRRDKYRSGSTPMTLVSSNWQTRWETAVASSPTGLAAEDWADDPFVRGIITPPVCASGVVLLAVPYRHQVLALDAASGAVRWTYTAGGRVDTPPTISGDLCVFGAHDGYVYCLSLADGQLAWRFRAAPREARIAVYGQMESPWPVAGGLLVENGVAYFAAGRHPNTDGGLRVYALAVRDGRVIWDKDITDTGVKGWYASTFMDSSIKVGLDYEPVDLMVQDGKRVAMSRWRFAPDTGEMTLAFSRTNYQTFGSLEVPRGIWGYGIRQNKQVWNKPPAVFNARGLTRGATNDTALLLAGDTLVKGRAGGEIEFGGQTVKLESAPVHDGLIAAYGRIYAATRQGKVYCLGARD